MAKVKADGTGLVYCGYIGGSECDYELWNCGRWIGMRLYIPGIRIHTETTFPVTVGPDLTYNGNLDAFVAKVKADGTGLDYCGYIGGIW